MHAIPFQTAEAGNGFKDLQRLKRSVEDARIVSLGEATHGTREFFQMKHRLLEFLVIELGFTHFIIESNMPEAQLINEYVLTGAGDPRALLKGLRFWTWNTEEVLNLIEWMRKFNAAGGRTIQFWGCDMLNPTLAAQHVREFTARVAPAHLEETVEAYKFITATGQALESDAQRRAALEGARAVLDRMQAQSVALKNEHPDSEWAIQNARLVCQAIQLPLSRDNNFRDRCMAENVRWILTNAPTESKAVLWAHNDHVARRGVHVSSMGSHLARIYGRELVVFGFTARKGFYTARQMNWKQTHFTSSPKPFKLAAPDAGSVEWRLQSAGLPRCIIEVRRERPERAGSAWLDQPLGMRLIGAGAAFRQFTPCVVSEQFDFLIYFQTTSASRLLH